MCQGCNSGWLSDLETTAQAIVGALVRGRRAILDGEKQRTVATWAYKTVLLFQMVRAEQLRAVPIARYRELYRIRRAPTDVRLWLAVTQSGSAVHETSTETNLTTTTATVPGFFSALALGNLSVLCTGRTSPGPQPIRIGARANPRALLPIWPASVRPVVWPPPVPLEDLDAAALVSLI